MDFLDSLRGGTVGGDEDDGSALTILSLTRPTRLDRSAFWTLS